MMEYTQRTALLRVRELCFSGFHVIILAVTAGKGKVLLCRRRMSVTTRNSLYLRINVPRLYEKPHTQARKTHTHSTRLEVPVVISMVIFTIGNSCMLRDLIF